MNYEILRRWDRARAMVVAGICLAGLIALWMMIRPEPRPLTATLLGSYFLGWGTVLVLSRSARSRMIARSILMTLALVFLLGSLELLSAVGLADFRTLFRTQGLDPRHNADNVPDPELIHVHKPYLKRSGMTRGDIASALHLTDTPLYSFDVAYDRNGFRNPRPLSGADIVVLGDSFVEGGLVAADDLMTTTLGQLLDSTVANLGQSAYGPQQELAVLRRFAAPMHPKLCIWTFYEGNDLEDVERYEQLTRSGGPADLGSMPRDRSFSRNAMQALSRVLGRILAPDATDQAPFGMFRDRDGRMSTLYFHDRGAPLSPREFAALDKVGAVLAAAHGACKAHGMRLLVVFAPGKFRVYKDHCTFRRDNPGARRVLDDLPERLRARVAAISPEIGFLDLTPALSAEAARGRLVYFADDTHWSAEGHQAAGRAVAAQVSRRDDLHLAGQTGVLSSPGVSGSRRIIFK
jgi:hypothetical protein